MSEYLRIYYVGSDAQIRSIVAPLYRNETIGTSLLAHRKTQTDAHAFLSMECSNDFLYEMRGPLCNACVRLEHKD